MAFVRKQGKTKFMYFPVTVSTAIAQGALVAFSGGALVPAANTLNSYDIIGVIRHAIAATDADYATARLVEVEVPVEKMVVWEAPVTVGTLATTSVGAYFDLTTADTGDAVDQSASSLDVVMCTRFISASKGEFVLNIGPDARLKANS